MSLTLFSAADRNCVTLATQLLDQGASVDARDRIGGRPLSRAAKSGHLEMVDLLLARDAPINARDLNGATALYFAAERGHASVVQRLIERGADVHLTGRSGVSLVAAAAYAGRDSIVGMLLAHGADAHVPDDTGKTPVVYAAAGGRLDIVKRLMTETRVDLNARYANDLTLLMWASGPDQGVPEDRRSRSSHICSTQAPHIDDRDVRGRTALMIAAEGGHVEISALLLGEAPIAP